MTKTTEPVLEPCPHEVWDSLGGVKICVDCGTDLGDDVEATAPSQPVQPVAWALYFGPNAQFNEVEFAYPHKEPLTDADKAAGWTATPLYTHPAPSPNVAGLVERLLEYCRCDPEQTCLFCDTTPTTLATLSAENERLREVLGFAMRTLEAEGFREDGPTMTRIRAALETKHD